MKKEEEEETHRKNMLSSSRKLTQLFDDFLNPVKERHSFLSSDVSSSSLSPPLPLFLSLSPLPPASTHSAHLNLRWTSSYFKITYITSSYQTHQTNRSARNIFCFQAQTEGKQSLRNFPVSHRVRSTGRWQVWYDSWLTSEHVYWSLTNAFMKL